jgi:two-component system phosphate regulon response regulator OmpR
MVGAWYDEFLKLTMTANLKSSCKRPGLTKTTGRARVLIVEDNARLRELMANVLALEGWAVTQAVDASSMRWQMHINEQQEYPDEPFDLIVTDVQIPGENGLEVLGWLRHKGCPIPAIVVTAFPELATREQVNEVGATLLPKPFSLLDFRGLAFAALRPGNRSLQGQ